jgi:hypothetical protein
VRDDVGHVLRRGVVGCTIGRHVGASAAAAAAVSATALRERHVVAAEFRRSVAEGLAIVDAEDRPAPRALEGRRKEGNRRREPPKGAPGHHFICIIRAHRERQFRP